MSEEKPAPGASRAGEWIAGAGFAVWIGLCGAIGPVPPWRGTGSLIAGLFVLLPLPGRMRAVLLAIAAAPLVLPAMHASWLPWLVGASVCGMAAILYTDRRERLILAGIVFGMLTLVAFLQVLAVWQVPAAASPAIALTLGWLCAALAIAAPTDRAAGGGFIAAALATMLATRLQSELIPVVSVERAAWLVVTYQADAWWPQVESRALAEVESGRLAGPLAVIRSAPHRVAVGQAVGRRYGADLLVVQGWDPRGQVDPALAVDVAFARAQRGNADRGVDLLRAQKREDPVATALAVLAAETFHDDLAIDAWKHAGEANAATPGAAVIGPVDLYAAGEVWASVETTAGMRGIDIRAIGDVASGPPELTATIVGVDVAVHGGPWPIDGVTAVEWPLDLAAGRYLVVVQYSNDRADDTGDRNVRGLVVTTR